MKRILFSSLLALTVLIGLSLYWHLPRSERSPNPRVGTQTNMLSTQKSQEQQETNPQAGTEPKRTVKKPEYVSNTAWNRLNRLVNRALRDNGPIEFYGLVKDQLGNPVEGVKVLCEVSRADPEFLSKAVKDPEHSSMFEIQQNERLERVTDQHGKFSVVGLEGFWLIFRSFEKEGYIPLSTPSSAGSYGFGGHRDYQPSSSQEKPVEFVMWKQQGAEPLIQREHWLTVAEAPVTLGVNLFADRDRDTNPLRPDIVFDNVSNEGQPPPSATDRNKWKWRCRIRFPEGGLLRAPVPCPLVAPTTGYSPVLEIGCDDPLSSDCFMGYNNAEFFFKLRGGKAYGKFSITLRPVADKRLSAVLIGYINPNGSPVFELDTSIEIRRPEEIQESDARTR